MDTIRFELQRPIALTYFLGRIFYVILVLGVALYSSIALADMGLAFNHLNSVMDEFYSGDSNALRFLKSYETLGTGSPDLYIEDAAYIHDNALALLAYLKKKGDDDLRRAKIIADSLVYAIDNDRYYTDGRLRNAYSAEHLIDSIKGETMLPGWWDSTAQQWSEDIGQISTYTGNMAWTVIALSQFYIEQGGETYKTAALTIGNWIYNNTYDSGGGYTSGFEGWEPNPNKLMNKSTEYNIDVYIAFLWLKMISGDSVWKDRALHARDFVMSMWSGNHLWIGTKSDGITIDYDHGVLDIQALVVLAFASNKDALGWAQQNCYTEADGFKGFDFNTDKDGIWFEGTAQMALAYMSNNEDNEADIYLGELRRVQTSALNNNGKGIVAAPHDNVTTGLGWNLYSRLHIGATSWYIFTEMMYNIVKPPPSDLSPVANAGIDQTVDSGETVTLDGSSSSDSDGTITSYQWTQTGGTPTVTLSQNNAVKPTFEAPSVSETTTLTFQLTVTDNDGLNSTDSVNIIVNKIPGEDGGGDSGCFISNMAQ